MAAIAESAMLELMRNLNISSYSNKMELEMHKLYLPEIACRKMGLKREAGLMETSKTLVSTTAFIFCKEFSCVH